MSNWKDEIMEARCDWGMVMKLLTWAISFFLALVCLALMLGVASWVLPFGIFAAILCYILADKRGRSRTLYAVWSLSLPIFTVLLLLFLGETDARKEEELRMAARINAEESARQVGGK